VTILCLKVLHFLGLAKVTFGHKNRTAQTTNLTLINFILTKTGPIKEYTLTRWVIFIQIFCSILAFIVRYGLAGLIYDGDRR
jgi:UDP-N-acetylglucosamine--dolichyl-phosphate N-acetylglucosaminephosphotransferase